MPEEINRLCTDAISDLLFTTEKSANLNLAREGVPKERTHFVGNTMIDTLLRHVDAGRALALPPQFQAGGYSVLTLHRPANVRLCRIAPRSARRARACNESDAGGVSSASPDSAPARGGTCSRQSHLPGADELYPLPGPRGKF